MMNGLELIRAAMGLQETERVPWVPFVGVHGGFLTGVDATRYLQSSALMTAGISKAIDMYQPDGIPVVFDLQLEAEVLGCALKWSSGTPPAVISHPLAEGRTLGDLPEFTSGKGRIPQVLETTRALMEKNPGNALYG